MDVVHELLAARYACALLRYSACEAHEDLAWRLDAFVFFLNRYQSDLMGLESEMFLRIAHIFELDRCNFDLLLKLLTSQKHEELFVAVVRSFAKQYKEQHGLEFCLIKSSHKLMDEQKKALCTFLEHASGKRIFYTTVVDRGLVAGIRVEGDSLIWEHSVSSQLRAIEQLQ
ncbi:TPA: hypothetical protein DDZ86_01670 [Candidatus Dependentiae bacterium]|nr:MAG: ATP synthase subunit delta [candidate division TM6 bacterium GW2011_GWF2_43_87]HBL98333.1 hypothetical protein [Candidatus Dependentiae bacterium]